MGDSRALFPLTDGVGLCVEIEPRESFRALLYRIAEVHGLRTIVPVLAACRQPGPRPFSHASLPAVARLCGTGQKDIAALGGRDADYDAGANKWHFHGAPVTHYPSVDVQRLPVCTQCLRQQLFVPALVHLGPQTACLEHRCRLQFDCPRCLRPLRSNRHRLSFCNCGFDLRDAVTQPALDEEMQFAYALHASARNSDSKCHVIPTIVRSQLGDLDLSAMTLDEVVYVHWAIGYAIQHPQVSCLGSRRRLAPLERVEASVQCIEMLSSPSALATACSAWVDSCSNERPAVAWFAQNVLRRVLAVRGMSCVASMVPRRILARRPVSRRPRERSTAERAMQLEFPFEAAAQ